MSPIINIMIDGVLAILLIAAIVACWFVYQRLAVIKNGQHELKILIDNLNAAVLNARSSVSDLKGASLEMEARLQGEVRRAQTMSDELTIITEAGNNLADRIDAGLTRNPTSKEPGPSSAAMDYGEQDVFSEPVESQDSNARKEQKELLAALREAR